MAATLCGSPMYMVGTFISWICLKLSIHILHFQLEVNGTNVHNLISLKKLRYLFIYHYHYCPFLFRQSNNYDSSKLLANYFQS